MTSIDNDALGRLGLTGNSGSGTDKPRDRLGQDEFMKLMIAQLTHQDPFDPMEGGEFLGQLAQFGTVSGIEDMRKSLEGLSGSIAGSQTLQAAGLVDREVLVPAREGWLPPEGSIRGAVDVPSGGSDVQVNVYDLSGRLVARVPVSAEGKGQAAFEWDGTTDDGGRAPAGFYELEAVGRDGEDSVALEAMVSGRVESVGVGARNGSVSLTVTGLVSMYCSTVR